jgi:hypothetical protein
LSDILKIPPQKIFIQHIIMGDININIGIEGHEKMLKRVGEKFGAGARWQYSQNLRLLFDTRWRFLSTFRQRVLFSAATNNSFDLFFFKAFISL